ncbi:MAG: hypothetical protein LIP01_08560 [Tannerellaceae bacterium]|nr:hypothetical protein [Tannerellaceae bacterium]
MQNVTFFPISAKDGDNVVNNSEKTPWYTGKSLLAYLEEIPVHTLRENGPGRFPIQYVIRPHKEQFHDFRGYAGRVGGGTFQVGDAVTILPSGGQHLLLNLFTRVIQTSKRRPTMSLLPSH